MPRACPLLNRCDTLSIFPAYFQACVSTYFYVGACEKKLHVSLGCAMLRPIAYILVCVQCFIQYAPSFFFYVSSNKLRTSVRSSFPEFQAYTRHFGTKPFFSFAFFNMDKMGNDDPSLLPAKSSWAIVSSCDPVLVLGLLILFPSLASSISFSFRTLSAGQASLDPSPT
mmetsp:Transcript_12881/g.23346  ORF Transcript_12881/g.23346 Transcript_12881/m.23346 type:complete len:169 (+) Transcript_12881:770-1276(+)